MRTAIITTTIIILIAALCSAAETPAPPEVKFLTVNAHIMAGGSYVTDNYTDVYPEISDMNRSMGAAVGLGVGVIFNLGRRWALGTELNFGTYAHRMDLAVAGAGKPSVSNVFQRSRAWVLDIPVFMRWTHRVADNVMWNIDAGLYYSYGTGGSQENTIYDAKTNDLGQLITSCTEYNTGYYNDKSALINSLKRADIGVHLGVGLTFARRLTVGVRSHLGLKNTALSTGITKPPCHNIDILAVAGWNF